jgi:hypothetical protein
MQVKGDLTVRISLATLWPYKGQCSNGKGQEGSKSYKGRKRKREEEVHRRLLCTLCDKSQGYLWVVALLFKGCYSLHDDIAHARVAHDGHILAHAHSLCLFQRLVVSLDCLACIIRTP